MKKVALLSLLASVSLSASAQLYLHGATGASPYVQNFNTITGGLPTGWSVDTGATATSIGTLNTFNTSVTFGVFDTANVVCTGSVRAAGFKNFASANVIHALDSCGAQNVCTDRAVGVRQTGAAGWDPGSSINLKLANTSGMSALAVSFKLQSLDTTSNRVTTWTLQYGICPTTTTNPTTFNTVAATGTMTTGGLTFTNNTITASFGSALDHLSTPVVIRLVTLSPTTGSGNRPSTAIDDFNLSWTGTATMDVTEVSNNPVVDLAVLGDASADKITFSYGVETEGNYTLSIYDLSGRILHTQTIATKPGTEQVSVNGLNLASGLYIAKLSNGNSSAVAKISVQ